MRKGVNWGRRAVFFSPKRYDYGAAWAGGQGRCAVAIATKSALVNGCCGSFITAQAVISGLWFGGALPNGDGRCLHLLVTLITVRVGGGYKERRRFRKILNAKELSDSIKKRFSFSHSDTDSVQPRTSERSSRVPALLDFLTEIRLSHQNRTPSPRSTL